MAKKLSELYKPKSEVGKAFVDANPEQKPVLKKSKPTENDGQFSATNVKTFKRAVNRMGYDVGDDEVENKGGVGVNDSPKETGIAPYTIRREDVERIDELSPKTLKSYVKKASGYGHRSAWGLAQKGEKEEDKSMSTDGYKYPEKQERHQKAASKLYHKSNNREKGVSLANAKIGLHALRLKSIVKEDIMESFNFEAEEPLSEDEVIDTLFDMLETMLGEAEYNKDAVNKSIESSNRSGRKIGKKEAKAIHSLLKGRKGKGSDEGDG